jgi:uncharacterized protein (TIGR02246 family)
MSMQTGTTSGTTTSDETAVRELLATLYAAWAAGDAAAFAAPYLDDATVVMPGVCHRGRADVEAYMGMGFAGPLKGSHVVDEVESVRFPAPDTAVVLDRATIVRAGETEPAPEREIVATWVLARRAGDWKVAAYANAPART